MDLPIRITDQVDAPVLSVDGAFGAPGLNLSHWPGNTTPAALKRDLSTEIALAFVALPEEEQAALAAGCTALVNNHYDTDGVLAMFALRHPEQALPRREAMLAAAAAGDLFRLPSEEAFALDRIVTRYCDPERSPLALDGLADRERYERATAALLEELPALLDGELESHADLWREDVARLQADLALLERSAVDEIVHLDLAVWTLSEAGDPGRHALWGKSDPDRQLVLRPGPDGTTARFLIGTKSWFDLVTERAQPRPDLSALATRLNELEGCDPEAERAWRHQSERGASPELWFGTAGLANYSEHAAPHLAPSRIDPLLLKNTVVDAVRATWVFSDDPDDDDGDWEYVGLSLLVEGTLEDPLVVVRSRLWQFNGIGFFSGDEAVVVDPGIDLDEIALLSERVTTAYREGPPRRVTHVLITHSHHDHIRGWSRFEGAEVILPRVAAEKDEGARSRILAAKNKIDQHLEVDDPGFAYPEADRVFDEQISVPCGELTLEMRFLPGHSNCTSVVWVPELRTLCTADYLVSPGLPYCRWQAAAFDGALATLRRWVEDLGVERIVPAHRDLHVGRGAALAAIEADAWAMRRTRELVREALAQGVGAERAARRAARVVGEERGVDVGKRARQDLDNAQRVAAEEAAD